MALSLTLCALTSVPAGAQSVRLNVEDNWQAYQSFLRDKDTRFFADDGLLWESFQLELVRGVKNADNSCSMDMSRTVGPGQRLSSAKSLNVAQAVNSRTCETLFKRGTAANNRKQGSLLPSSILALTREESDQTGYRASEASASQASAQASGTEGVGYKHAASLRIVWDDGNHPIWRYLGNIHQLSIGQAVASFVVYPHHRQGEKPTSDDGCVAGTDAFFNYEEPAGGIINEGASRDWTASSVGCGALFDWRGRLLTGLANGNINGTAAQRPYTGALAGFCSSLAKNINACFRSTPLGSIAAGTAGRMNNNTSLCVPGVYCAFDCTAGGGLTIDVENLSVRYSAPVGFEVTNRVTYGGPVPSCRENLRVTYEETFEEFAPCAGESNCYYYLGNPQ